MAIKTSVTNSDLQVKVMSAVADSGTVTRTFSNLLPTDNNPETAGSNQKAGLAISADEAGENNPPSWTSDENAKQYQERIRAWIYGTGEGDAPTTPLALAYYIPSKFSSLMHYDAETVISATFVNKSGKTEIDFS